MALLRSLFSRQEKVWRPFCDEVGGTYVTGGFFKAERIEIPHQDWLITVAAERDPETRQLSTALRCRVELSSGVMLGLLQNWPGQKVLNLLISLFGLRQASVAGLADDSIVLAKELEHAEAIFGNQQVQESLAEQPKLLLSVGKPPRQEVYLAVPAVIQDLGRLKSLVELCKRVLDTLFDAGLISRAKAG